MTPGVDTAKSWFSDQKSRISNLGGVKRVIYPPAIAPEDNNKNYGSYTGTYNK
jgi:hypothetical protein